MSAAEKLPPPEETALAIIPASQVSTIVSADKAGLLGQLHAELAGFKPDISNQKGRDEIASKAAKVAKTKMNLIRLGKSLTEDWRAKTKAVNAECNLIEERMDELRDQVRAPLTDYENAEKARIAGHETALTQMQALSRPDATETAAQITGRMVDLEAAFNRAWDQDFRAKAYDYRSECLNRLQVAHAAAERREAEAAELARLRAEAEGRRRQDEERARQEREARIARDAEARAKQQAEDAAKAETERLERERQEAEQRARQAEERARDAAEQAERDRAAAAERAEADRLQAIEAERKRVADEQTARDAEARRREADKQHKGRINREALTALVAAGVSDQAARTAIAAIANRKVPHVTITY